MAAKRFILLSLNSGRNRCVLRRHFSSAIFKNITVDNNGKIFKITLNRPEKKNALTPEMYKEIQDAMKQAASGKSLLTVFTGNGDFYCSGNDLGNFMVDPKQMKQVAASSRQLLQDYVASYIDHPKPLVALVNGPAVGIAVTVLGLFDLVFASDLAWFHTPFSTLGQSPEGVSSMTFPQIMGLGKATEFLVFNKKVTAQEAHRLGLVTDVFPANNFDQEANKRIGRLAALPSESVILSRYLIRSTLLKQWHEVNKNECALLEERWQSEECLMAISKFFSKAKK